MVRYCPGDDGAYEEWVEYCPECGRKLVSTAPLPGSTGAPGKDDPIVYLATIANEPLAVMWVQTLRNAGIRAMAKPLGPGVGAWASAATLEHALYVLHSQRVAARAVMADVEDDGGGGEG